MAGKGGIRDPYNEDQDVDPDGDGEWRVEKGHEHTNVPKGSGAQTIKNRWFSKISKKLLKQKK